MIKTVSINLGGIVFQIDEDAFEALRNYLDSVTQYYKYQEGRDDIVSDIESRFAEIFSESMHTSGFDVISMGDVEEVIGIMGRPQDFDGEGDRFDAASEGTTRRRGPNDKVLYRDKDKAVLAGVCAGLSAYWGIKDPLWLRLAFIATALFSAGTIGVVVYIILWIVVPEATTSAQQLEMHGEPVNLSNLEKKIRSEINEAGEKITEFTNTEASNGLRSVVNGIGKVFGAFAKLVVVLFKFAASVFVITMIVGGVITLIALLFSFLVTVPISLKYIFTGVLSWLPAVIGGLLVLVIPLLFLVYLPFRVFGRRKIHNRNASNLGIGLLIFGVILAFGAFSIAASYFSEKETYATQEAVPYPANDTLYLSMNNNTDDYNGLDYNIKFSNFLTFTRKLETASDWVELDIIPSTDSLIHLERTYRAHGRTVSYAKDNAASITYGAIVDGDELRFNPVFGLGDKKKWRNQSVRLRLKVPEGMVIVPSHDMAEIIDDAHNTLKAGSHTVAGNRWMMHNSVLEPIDSVLTMGSSWGKRNMQQLDFTYFDHLDIRGDMDIEIVQSDIFEVYMTDEQGNDGEIEINQDGTTLSISREGWSWGDASIGFLNNRSSDPKFYIGLPDLKALDVHRQAHVVISGFKLESLIMDLGGQSSVYFDGLEVTDLTVDIHGQSNLDIEGEATTFSLDASGQSNFDGKNFSVNRLKLKMSGQSDAEMIINESVVGELHGQSDFEYWGDPEVDVSSHGQSDLDRRY